MENESLKVGSSTDESHKRNKRYSMIVTSVSYGICPLNPMYPGKESYEL
jgi:hypothetical protein